MLKKRLGAECIERKWWSNRNLKDYFKITSPLTIPEGCEKIGNCAFWECERLEKVKISESVKVIGEDAFYKCENLRKVIISRSVERIEHFAFGYCYNSEITLRKSKSEFKEIRENAFWGCKDVKEEVRD